MIVQLEINTTRRFPHGDFNGFDGRWEPGRHVQGTSRGVLVRLRRNERLNHDGQEWDGSLVSVVELRQWHDGSVTVERVMER